MPELRKIIKVGRGKMVSIPVKWLTFYERTLGIKISEVTVEIDGELKIRPYVPMKKERDVHMTDRSGSEVRI